MLSNTREIKDEIHTHRALEDFIFRKRNLIKFKPHVVITTFCSYKMRSYFSYICTSAPQTSLNNLYIYPEIQFRLCIYGNGFHFRDVINVSQTFSPFRQLLHIQTIKRHSVTFTLLAEEQNCHQYRWYNKHLEKKSIRANKHHLRQTEQTFAFGMEEPKGKPQIASRPVYLGLNGNGIG